MRPAVDVQSSRRVSRALRAAACGRLSRQFFALSCAPTVAAKLSHTDGRGRARMVDVPAKPATLRLVARAVGARGKGDVLAVARLAGMMAAKRTPDLIPLCHPVRLVGCELDLTTDRALPGVRVQARA